ncbi:ABC-F family ATP-binding cassette domain-containing protein [Sinanaerobacter chloroacetimidivorans]|uniref:ABC-F family ATP-binding cassette domain-containing protein n=1 Tax=Sinanaerobacter chloroacetimidivorans TaxID=2818044 RepID=A0A8J8B1L6_9FIRM|nr:ABC-F family ATP-binding cassette domain-containing protein [Sinanaerobacter chloroacetimidivorans]MBR0598838.1 ABC-F family ATP-binding cassette domain-containing protein [Sinanaerobacter chloroacetimidivorans]
MILLNADKISKSYTEVPLLKEISLSIHEGDKIGLIGVNGTGKSTLLKILAGLEEADSGTITKTNGITIGYLPQNPSFQKELSVMEQILLEIPEHERDVREFECKTILTKLGISDFEKPVYQLSGGEKKRVALAGVLVHPVDLLILDEPTNHIDSEMADWLEKYLVNQSGAIVLITHDRYFLDRVTNKIGELTGDALYFYEGNYSKYLDGKIAREEMALSSERKRLTLYRKELQWIRRGVRARGTKSKSRLERFEELKNSALQFSQEKLQLQTKNSRLGKKVLELHHISKSFGNKVLITDFSYTFLRNDRVGIVGPNGSGKSTLLKMILGVLPLDKGNIEIGETVKIGYFSQENEEMDLSLRVIDYIQSEAYQVSTDHGTLSASQMLERFLFPSFMHSVPLGRLSGGERRRLYLLKILMSAPNVLIFDEPTNDLDIQTLTILEDYLDSFPGAVIAVSHDRYFLDRVAVRIFAFQGNGEIGHYPGGYSDYLEMHQLEKEEQKSSIIQKADKNNPKKSDAAKPAKVKFTYNEQREYESIDGEIACLEDQLADLDDQIAKETSNHLLLQELLLRKEALDQELTFKMERWIYLNELAEQMKK